MLVTIHFKIFYVCFFGIYSRGILLAITRCHCFEWDGAYRVTETTHLIIRQKIGMDRRMSVAPKKSY